MSDINKADTQDKNEQEQINEIIKQSKLEYQQMNNDLKPFSFVKLIAFVVIAIFIMLIANTIKKTHDITNVNDTETIHVEIDSEGNIINTTIEQEDAGE